MQVKEWTAAYCFSYQESNSSLVRDAKGKMPPSMYHKLNHLISVIIIKYCCLNTFYSSNLSYGNCSKEIAWFNKNFFKVFKKKKYCCTAKGYEIADRKTEYIKHQNINYMAILWLFLRVKKYIFLNFNHGIQSYVLREQKS